MARLQAQSFIVESGSVADTADALAAAINVRLGQGESVQVAMGGFPGVSSSFFNLVLRRVGEAHGIDVIDQRLTFEFTSTVQAQIYQRSLQSATNYLRDRAPTAVKAQSTAQPTVVADPQRRGLLGRIFGRR